MRFSTGKKMECTDQVHGTCQISIVQWAVHNSSSLRIGKCKPLKCTFLLYYTCLKGFSIRMLFLILPINS